ncbi:hypothetical protein DVS28_a1072 [Euzebya pacifica]|uniref:Uncharacterized protein n=1 Tax=Euzebya pacifica TaxID=1608957 RepID=A0A346XU76_9ACTN|nr:hypothetical protein DVS28_a1072 [Euzebya pacifica]
MATNVEVSDAFVPSNHMLAAGTSSVRANVEVSTEKRSGT